MPVSPIDDRLAQTADRQRARSAVPHSAASITVSDQPSDADAVTCSQARRYRSALVASSTCPWTRTRDASPRARDLVVERLAVVAVAGDVEVTPGSSISMSSSSSMRLYAFNRPTYSRRGSSERSPGP